jgi:predicted enzyme related to lactoylglutathione lyase
MFCWVELATKDGPAAKKFYTSLFDWRVNDMPIGEGETYSMLEKKGKEAGALYELSPQQKSVSPRWNSYIRVIDADEAAVKAEKLGGRIHTEPFDVLDSGRMANIVDPTGAIFAVWQPKSHIGAEIVNEPGAFCWNELYTTDTKRAGDFYSKLFGWTREPMTMPTGQEYTIFKKGDAQAAGMMELPREWKVSPHWLVYFAVDDSDRTVSKASGMGAKVMMPPTDIPNVGRFAILNDPQGADFSVIHMEPPSQS